MMPARHGSAMPKPSIRCKSKLSRIIDGLEIVAHQAVSPLPIDLNHLAVTGCSYAGKMALFADAFDERVALTVAQENGGGGAPSWRVSQEIEAQGSVEKQDNTDGSWFMQSMKTTFARDNVYKIPKDHHELMAMVDRKSTRLNSSHANISYAVF